MATSTTAHSSTMDQLLSATTTGSSGGGAPWSAGSDGERTDDGNNTNDGTSAVSLLGVVDDGRSRVEWDDDGAEGDEVASWEQGHDDREPGDGRRYGIDTADAVPAPSVGGGRTPSPVRTTDWNKHGADRRWERAEWEREKDDWRNAMLRVQVSFATEEANAGLRRREVDQGAWDLERATWEKEREGWRKEREGWERQKATLVGENSELHKRLEVSIRRALAQAPLFSHLNVTQGKALHTAILPTVYYPIVSATESIGPQIYETAAIAHISLNGWVSDKYETKTSRDIRKAVWRTTKAAACRVIRIKKRSRKVETGGNIDTT